MIFKENVSENKYPKPTIKTEPCEKDARPMMFRRAAPVVLDMGEASREEGFRLNGCR